MEDGTFGHAAASVNGERDGYTPLFSVLVPSYNRARYVVEALESIRAQTFTDYELIVIDDCSSDNSAARVEEWLVATQTEARFLRHDVNVGLVGVFNEFATIARGRFLTWCACDDAWLHTRLERHAALFRSADDRVAIICGNCDLIDADGRSLGPMFDTSFQFPSDPYVELLSLNRVIIATPSCSLRKEYVDAVGRWNPAYLQEDFDMYLRLTERYAVVYADEVLTRYRQLPDSFGKSKDNASRFALDALHVLAARNPRSPRERKALERGRVRLFELAYVRAHEPGSTGADEGLRRLLDTAASLSFRCRFIAWCIRANVPVRVYRAVVRMFRLLTPGAAPVPISRSSRLRHSA
jgi:glycosyltransferase involved in cell wall biosynthesis